MLTGNDAVVGKAKIGFNEVVTVVSNKATLKNTPVGKLTSVYTFEADGTNGKEYVLGEPTTNENEYSISGKEITFNTAVTDGTQIRVYYTVETSEESTTIKVTSDQFGQSFRVELDCIVVDEFEKKAYKAQIQIPTAKFEDNFSFSLSVDGDPAVLDLVLELLKPAGSVDMFKMVIYDENTIA
ncbi:hypothetical protein ACR77J_08100 [Tissierella praeacuta]|uniref:hypothetical protein n=1 Tax=Tissierella praeacuta TaxID=43131 RepID=UPI003DA35AF8